MDPHTKSTHDMDILLSTTINKIKTSCEDQVRNLQSTLKLLNEEYFNDFCSKCDEHCRNLADDFDKAMHHKFQEYESKIKLFETKLISLEQKIKSTTNSITPCPSPVRSNYNARSTQNKSTIKHTFGPTKSPHASSQDMNTIPHYFKSSIEFWHQADKY